MRTKVNPPPQYGTLGLLGLSPSLPIAAYNHKIHIRHYRKRLTQHQYAKHDRISKQQMNLTDKIYNLQKQFHITPPLTTRHLLRHEFFFKSCLRPRLSYKITSSSPPHNLLALHNHLHILKSLILLINMKNFVNYRATHLAASSLQAGQINIQ